MGFSKPLYARDSGKYAIVPKLWDFIGVIRAPTQSETFELIPVLACSRSNDKHLPLALNSLLHAFDKMTWRSTASGSVEGNLT